ncbi:MAG: hypothetical protein R2779_10800 [Crocinitomicaceae bacterium]
MPTATIAGSTTVCQNASSPINYFYRSQCTPNYTFSYSLNAGAPQTITTTGGTTRTINVPTTTPGTYTYSLISVAAGCSQSQTEL